MPLLHIVGELGPQGSVAVCAFVADPNADDVIDKSSVEQDL
jgi:hypothetical protein